MKTVTVVDAAQLPSLDEPVPLTWIEEEAERRLRGRPRVRLGQLRFDPTPYGAQALARARRIWTARATAEHESALVYAQLTALSGGAGAPLATQLVLIGMAEDDLRHAALCRDVAAALGASAVPPAATPVARAGSAAAVEEHFLRQVVYGNCLVESVNAASLADACRTASDPYLREALRQLLADDARHARFGFEILGQHQALWRRRPALKRALDSCLPRAFASLEREVAGAAQDSDGFGPQDEALGNVEPGRAAELLYRTVEKVIVPGLERLGLGARAGWERRGRPSGEWPHSAGRRDLQ